MRASVERAVQPSTVLDVQARWYACYTRARHEKQVDRLLRARGIESFLPTVRAHRQWKDRRKLVSLVLFPSYVFARFSLGALYQVLAVPGLASMVWNNGQLVAISDDELANVRRFAEVLSAGAVEPEVRPLPAKGDRIRITSGPFRGIEGVVIERRRRCRILVGLEVIGWGAEVEVGPSMIEQLPESQRSPSTVLQLG